jgi:type II secretory pathway pseudopilin PulG
MVGKRQAGFTIIEITLFMAITGLLFLIAVAGTGNTIRTFRFTDSGRSLEAFVQRQYDDVINGYNNRSSSVSCSNGAVDTSAGQTVGSSNCLLMGKLVVFRSGNPVVTTYNVVGTEPSGVNYSLGDDALISAFQPQAITNTATSTYTIPWGNAPSGFKRTSDNTATNGLLLIRSPKSSRLVSYTFAVPATVPNNLTATVNDAANRSQATNFCIKNADGIGAAARLEITGGASQSAAKIIFNAVDTECNGV